MTLSPVVSWILVGGVIAGSYLAVSILHARAKERAYVRELAAKRKAAARKGAITRAHGRALEDNVWSEWMDAEIAKRNRYRASIGLGPLPSRPKHFGRWN